MMHEYRNVLRRAAVPTLPNVRERIWLSCLCLAGVSLLYTPSPGYYDPRLLRALWGFGHFGLFLVLAVTVMGWLAPRWRGSSLSLGLTVLGGLVAFGALTEVLQGLTPDREPSVEDLLMDGFGALLGLAVSPHFIARVELRWRNKLFLLAMPGLMLGMLPFVSTLADEFRALKQFPELASFETGGEMVRWSGSADYRRSDAVVRKGSSSMEIDFQPAPFSGVRVRHFPQDWTGFQTLHMDIWAERDTSITVRVHDRQHESDKQRYEDRFNRRFDLVPGWNSIDIPLVDIALAPEGRVQDLQFVREVGIFTTQLTDTRRVYLDNLRLQP